MRRAAALTLLLAVTPAASQDPKCKTAASVDAATGVWYEIGKHGTKLYAGPRFFALSYEGKKAAAENLSCAVGGAFGGSAVEILHWQTGKRVGSFSLFGGVTID